METKKGSTTQAVILWGVTALVGLNLALAAYFMTSRPGKQSADMVAVDREQTEKIRAREAAVSKERDERIARRRVSDVAATAGRAPAASHGGTAVSHGSTAAATPTSVEVPKPAALAVAAPAGGTAAAPSISVAAGSGPSVLGTIKLRGTPPPEREIIQLMKDKNCGPTQKETPTTRHYLVGPGGGLANVFVYIKSGLEGKTFPVPSEKVEVDQKGCLYFPYMSGARAGQTVTFINSDSFMHNVQFAKSKSGNPTFNFAQSTAGTRTEKMFPNPEVLVAVQCQVHPWMFGYIGVSAHPFFAVTDAEGKFKFPTDLPPGDYVLEAVHLKAGKASAPFKIAAGQQATASFEFAPATAP